MVKWPWSKPPTLNIHVTDALPAVDTGEIDRSDFEASREHSDQLPSLQNNLIRHIEYSDPNARWLHTKANPYANQHTYGVIDKMWWNMPYPFQYVPADTEDIKTATKIPAMDKLHEQWNEVDMFHFWKELQAQAMGVGAAWLVQIQEGKFKVFNTAHIDGEHIWKNPKTMEVVEVWLVMKGSGLNAKGDRGANSIERNEDVIVKAKPGKNCVQFMPNPDPDCENGRADILRVWTPAIYRAANHYYSTLYSKKGGVNSRLLIAPDNVGPVTKKMFKKEALKGIESELIEVYYPNSLISEKIDPSHIVTWAENKGNQPAFDKTDALLATDSPLPPSFTQGPQTGALGGNAPVVDAKEVNRILISYAARVQAMTKDLNKIFFGVEDTKYMVVPFLMDETVPGMGGKIDPKTGKPLDPKEEGGGEKGKGKGDKPSNPDQETKDTSAANTRTADVQFHRVALKANAKNKGAVIYKGNMLSSGFYQYERYNWLTGEKKTVHEHLHGDEIKKFIDDPLTVKELYLDIEHNQMTDVVAQTSVGKVVIKGHTTVDGVTKDDTELHFKPEWDPKHNHIFLSPIYTAQLKDNGMKWNGEKAHSQTDISIINCSLCHYPRSSLTGLDTSAERQP